MSGFVSAEVQCGEQAASCLKSTPADNVAVALEDIAAGETLEIDGFELTAREDIDRGHKIALSNIRESEDIIKYGFPIGHATRDIAAGEYIHTHNIKTNLKGLEAVYVYACIKTDRGNEPDRPDRVSTVYGICP